MQIPKVQNLTTVYFYKEINHQQEREKLFKSKTHNKDIRYLKKIKLKFLFFRVKGKSDLQSDLRNEKWKMENITINSIAK